MTALPTEGHSVFGGLRWYYIKGVHYIHDGLIFVSLNVVLLVRHAAAESSLMRSKCGTRESDVSKSLILTFDRPAVKSGSGLTVRAPFLFATCAAF